MCLLLDETPGYKFSEGIAGSGFSFVHAREDFREGIFPPHEGIVFPQANIRCVWIIIMNVS